jgi:hypothetical protein
MQHFPDAVKLTRFRPVRQFTYINLGRSLRKCGERNYMKLDKKAFEAIRALVIYLAPDEGKHFSEEGRPRNHIYRDVLTVARWLDEQPNK